MRKIIILLLSILLIGCVAALPNFGPPSGINVKALSVEGTSAFTGTASFTGTVSAEQLTSTDDATITDRITFADGYASDDLYVLDDFYVGSVAALNATTATTGYFSSTLGAAGTSGLNYTTVTDLRAADDGYFVDAFGVGGTSGLNYTTVTDIRASDDGYITDAFAVGGTAALNTTTTTDIRATDDGLIDDDFFVDGTATLNDAVINTTLDVNGATTTENITLTQDKRLTFNTAGTGYIQWLTSGNYMTIKGNPQFDDGYTWAGTASPSSASDLVAIGGASDIDFHLSSGTTQTGTGAVTLNGATTVATTKTLAVTDADALTVGGVIVPQEMVINWPISASSVDENIFIADDAWRVTKIEEVHAVAGSEGAPNLFNATVVKISGVTAPGSGLPMHNATITLSATANTVITPTLSTIAANSTLADGDKIGVNYQGTGTSLAGGVITIHMKRV
jgi:hypothetical protein